MTDEGTKTFDGFKKIFSDYVNGYKTFDDIKKEYLSLKSHINDNDVSKSINAGYNKILTNILNDYIKYDKEAIIKSIKDTDKKLVNNDYYLIDKSGQIISGNYNNVLNKFLYIFIDDPSNLTIDKISNMINKITNAIYMINYNEDINYNVEKLKRSSDLYYALLKIINLVKNKEIDEYVDSLHNKNLSGKGLKIIMPKQMLSRLPVLLARLHAGNNSAKLKNEIRQLLYLLYRSKKISKTVYNNLIATM